MKVGFIGAGKVGTAIGAYFNKKGIVVTGYCSRSISSAVQAASAIGSRVFESFKELAEESDLIVLTVPDDLIEAVAKELSILPVHWEEKIILHMSGVHASDILQPLEEMGAAVCSVHPMLSFGDTDAAVRALGSAPFTIEGKGAGLDAVKKLLDICSNDWTEISTRDKAVYHAAACVLSNYLVTLLDSGVEMLQASGFTYAKAMELSEPLIRKTLDNVMNMGTKKALTGPISRGDAGTVDKHLEKLKNLNRYWLELYILMGLGTADLAKRAGKIDEESAARIQEVLGKYE